jgi:hypothetical protein
MRLLSRWPAVASLLLAAAATAQLDVQVSDVAPGPGTIRGRVVHAGSPEGVGSLDVVLYALQASGHPGVRRVQSDEMGAFVFEGVSTDPETVYMVGVRSGDLPYGVRATFSEGQQEIDVVLEVTEHDTDTSQARVGTTTVRIERGCNALHVREAHELFNATDQVIFVPEEQRGGRTPILRARLPVEASELTTPLGTLPIGLERVGHELRFWGPLYPGSQELEFGYTLPGTPGIHHFERGFPAGAPRLVLVSDARGPELQATGMHPGENRRLDGQLQRTLQAANLAPMTRVTVTVEVPPPVSELTMHEAQLWLELDDAALQVDEQHVVSVDGDRAIETRSDAPLLCLPLPEGAEELRFSPQTLAAGLALDALGTLALHGPLPAGESTLSIQYRLRVSEDPVVFSRRFDRELPLLSVLVAETGVRTATERLHRRRPVRRSDRTYHNLEGFQIAAGQPVDIELTRVAAPRPLGRRASVGFSVLAAAAVLAFLLGPLRQDRDATPEPDGSRAEDLVLEREGLYAAIRDIDEDFETGKLTAADHQTLRAGLRTQAVELLQRERQSAPEAGATPSHGDGPATASPTPAATAGAPLGEPRFCVHCGAGLPRGARFCPQCGVELPRQGNRG